MKQQFPGLASSLQEPAARAAKMNLAITHYNSGATGKAARDLGNGTRFFHSPGGKKVSHFRGDHLFHARNHGETLAFLAGYEAALTAVAEACRKLAESDRRAK